MFVGISFRPTRALSVLWDVLCKAIDRHWRTALHEHPSIISTVAMGFTWRRKVAKCLARAQFWRVATHQIYMPLGSHLHKWEPTSNAPTARGQYYSSAACSNLKLLNHESRVFRTLTEWSCVQGRQILDAPSGITCNGVGRKQSFVVI